MKNIEKQKEPTNSGELFSFRFPDYFRKQPEKPIRICCHWKPVTAGEDFGGDLGEIPGKIPRVFI
jgi:hypothetical protein